MSQVVWRTRSRLRWLVAVVLSAGLAAAPAASAAGKKTPAKPVAGNKAASKASPKSAAKKKTASKKKRSRRARRGAWKRRGQQAMDQQRIRQIQEALLREKYLAGEPTGTWDERTRQAMMKYQQDNGWQTKVLPDSRALIKMGLGPNYAEVINPDSLAAPEGSPPPAGPGAGANSKPQR